MTLDQLILVLGGNIAHLLIKLSLALMVDNFSFEIFIRRNLVGWMSGLVISMLYAHATVLSGYAPPPIDFLGYGLAGSSLGKNLIKYAGKV